MISRSSRGSFRRGNVSDCLRGGGGGGDLWLKLVQLRCLKIYSNILDDLSSFRDLDVANVKFAGRA